MMSVGEQGAVLRRLEDRGDGAGTGWLRVVSQFEGDAWELQVRVLLADGTAWASVAHLSGTLEGHQNGAHGDLLAA